VALAGAARPCAKSSARRDPPPALDGELADLFRDDAALFFDAAAASIVGLVVVSGGARAADDEPQNLQQRAGDAPLLAKVGSFPNEQAITCLIGAMLLEQNDEWAVRGVRYMKLDTTATKSDDLSVGLLAAAAAA
jgi:putative transposase